MTILDKYIGKNLIYTVLISSLALLAIDLFFYFANEIRHVGDGNYTLWLAVQYVFLTIPRRIYTMFPWAVLIGALLSLGSLSKNSEIISMRSSAMSVNRIAWSVVKATLILSVFMLVVGELLAPIAERVAKQTKAFAITDGKTIYTMSGTWVRHDDEFIHIGLVSSSEKLNNITRFKLSDTKKLQEIIFAKEANYNSNNKEWKLEDITGTEIKDNKISEIYSDQIKVKDLLDPEIIETSAVEHLERLSAKNLWEVMKSRSANDLNSKEYELAFWKKIINPIAIVAMVYLAIPFSFGSSRNSSLGLKILIGVIVGFIFYTLNSILTPLITIINLPVYIAAILPTTLFAIAGFYGIKRIK